MIGETAAQQIRTWRPGSRFPVRVRQTRHPEQEAFTGFTRAFSRLSDAVAWEPEAEETDLPGFILKDNIVYSALPLEKELGPFLRGLETMGNPGLSSGVEQLLGRIHLPCRLTLYIALQCPHCPGMVEALIPLAAHCPDISLHIIDGNLFPEPAGRDRVMAAPCLILDGGFRWTGAVSPEEVITMILDRDPAKLGTETLKNILESGEADWISREMIHGRSIFDGFLGLLFHETWSVRLGAMVVVETLAAEAPDLAKDLVPPLMAAFAGREVPVQGDILYALGEIGDRETARWIQEAVGESDHQDLKDAALEAVETIASRQ